MAQYTIHPIVMGRKVFDKSMMTYQYGQGEQYTIPIYTWVIKGCDKGQGGCYWRGNFYL